MHPNTYSQIIHSDLWQTSYRSNGIWKVNERWQFRKYLTLHCIKKSQRESLCCLKKNIHCRLNFFHIQPDLYPSITKIVEAMKTLTQERHNHSESCITFKLSRRTQKLRFTFQMNHLALRSLVRTWGTFSVAMLAMNWEWCWEEKDITNQNLLTTLSEYSHSRYTPT